MVDMEDRYSSNMSPTLVTLTVIIAKLYIFKAVKNTFFLKNFPGSEFY